MMKKILVCSLFIILLLTGCGKEEKKLSSVIVSFNPEFLVSFDENKVVQEIQALNDDSKIYLTNELLNIKVDKFVDKFVEISQENGYLKNEDVEVVVKSYDGNNNDVIEEMKTSLKNEHKIEVQIEEIKETEKETIDKALETTEKIIYKEPTAEEQKKAEDARLAEEQKKAEDARLAEEQKKAEDARLAEEQKKAEEARLAEEQKKAEEAKKQEEQAKKYDYNLNENIKLDSKFYTSLEYVYPQNTECIKKDPFSITIPDGQTYNSYCQNKSPNFKSVISGKGYYCTFVKNNSQGDYSVPGIYECTILTKIIALSKVSSTIDKIVKANNAIPIGGGRGDADTITLTEALCKKYSLSCGRW